MTFTQSQYSIKSFDSNVKKFIDAVKIGSSFSVVAPVGFGKSNIFKFISSKEELKRIYPYLKDIELIYLDLNGIFSNDIISFLIFISSEILNVLEKKNFILSDEVKNYYILLNSTNNTQSAISIFLKITDYIVIQKKVVLIFDNFEKYIYPLSKEILDLVKFLRDRFKTNLEFVFVFSNFNYFELVENGNIGPISDLILSKVIYFNLLSFLEFNLAFRKKHNYSEKKLKTLYKLSGGYLAFMKIFEQDKLDFQEILYSIEIKKIVKSLIGSFTNEQIEVIKEIAANTNILIKKIPINLIKTGIVKVKGNNIILFSEIFTSLINNIINESSINVDDNNLTNNESKILKTLLNTKNSLVSKNEIAQVIWGDRITTKYSNWAIDQQINRLRKKFKNNETYPFEILTKRGRGYILKNI